MPTQKTGTGPGQPTSPSAHRKSKNSPVISCPVERLLSGEEVTTLGRPLSGFIRGKPLALLWCGFGVFVAFTMLVLVLSSLPVELRTMRAAPDIWFPLPNVAQEIPHLSSPFHVLLLCGGSLLLGWCWLLAAGLSYVIKPHGLAVRAFARWATMAATLLITAYELHTSQKLWPVFLFIYALMQSSLVEFFLFFPRPEHSWVSWLRIGLRLADLAMGLLFGIAIIKEGCWIPLFGKALVFASIVGFGLTLFGVFRRALFSKSRPRAQMLVAAFSVLPLHVLFLFSIFFPQLCQPYLLWLGLPCGFLGVTNLMRSMLRHDLWDSEVVVPGAGLRSLLVAVLSFVGGLFTVLLLRSITALPLAFQLVFALAFVSISGPLHSFVGMWLGARLFPAEALYRPTVDDLIVRFTDLRTRTAVIETVERTVLSVIACERAKLLSVSSPARRKNDTATRTGPASGPGKGSEPGSLPDPGQSSNVPLMGGTESVGETGKVLLRLTQRAVRRALRRIGIEQPRADQLDALCTGQLVYVGSERVLVGTTPGLWAWLLVPIRFREQVIGILAVSPKTRGPLFSSLDQELLLTIAHQAALALANTIALEELDELRRAEHSAQQERLDRAISTIAAEIAHEIRFPINFFRMLVERQELALQQKRTLLEKDWAEDLDIGKEEVARLERMADRLRKMALSRNVQPRPVSLRAMADHVRLLLADRLQAQTFKVEIQDGIELLADPDALIQVLLNLLANALDAIPASGVVGFATGYENDGRLRMVVWDNGPGFAAEIARIFEPWFTTKTKGTGLGLAITHRLVRAHGWEIVAKRRDELTCFDVLVPVGEWRICSTGENSLSESSISEERPKSNL